MAWLGPEHGLCGGLSIHRGRVVPGSAAPSLLLCLRLLCAVTARPQVPGMALPSLVTSPEAFPSTLVAADGLLSAQEPCQGWGAQWCPLAVPSMGWLKPHPVGKLPWEGADPGALGGHLLSIVLPAVPEQRVRLVCLSWLLF